MTQQWISDDGAARHVAVSDILESPHKHLDKPVIDELDQLVVHMARSVDPSGRDPVASEENGFFTQYSVEELTGCRATPPCPGTPGASYAVTGDLRPDDGAAKVIIAAMNGDAMGGGFELTLAATSDRPDRRLPLRKP